MSKRLMYLFSFILVLGLTTTFAKADISDGLVAYWPLDEGTGTTTADVTGNGNNGTLLGAPTWVGGKLGGALDFDGIDDAVDCGLAPVLDFGTGNFTVSVWIKTSVNPNDDKHIFQKGDDDFENWAMEFRDNSGGDIEYEIENGADYKAHTNDDHAENLRDDEWHHIVMMRENGTENALMRVYVDGTENISFGGYETIPADLDIDTSAGNAFIGANYDGSPDRVGGENFFVGLIDDVAVWNRALTAEEVTYLWNNGDGNTTALSEPGKASSPGPADGALHSEKWVSPRWNAGDFAVTHDVYFSDNFDDVNDGTGDAFIGNQDGTYFLVGLPTFAYPDGLVHSTTYYWRIDEVNDADPNSPWKGDIWSFTVLPGTAYNPDPADGAEFVNPNAILSWAAGLGGQLHTVYIGTDFDDVNDANDGTSQAWTTYIHDTLELGKVYYWRVDEYDGTDTYKGDIWSFTTPGAVGNSVPANGAGDVKMTATLSWIPADSAASHEVYFGTDKDAVRNADKNSPEYKGPRTLGTESYDPGKLALYTTYYWRVDEVDSLGGLSKGPPWSFTTADFISVDDFEDYDTGDKQIWYAWQDGLGYGAPDTPPYSAGNGTGSAVGDETTPSYCEEIIVHGGGKSMPVFYDNNKQGYAYYSEVELALSTTRDWNEEDVGTLTIWFRGKSDNDAEPLYVAVSNAAGVSAVGVNDDPAAAQIDTWTEWIIPLQDFEDQGIVLTDVDRIAIGLGTKGNITVPGGSGKMYLDDIRLYRSSDAAEE